MENNTYMTDLQNMLWKSELYNSASSIIQNFISDPDFSHSNVILYGGSNFIRRMISRKHIVKEDDYYTLKFTTVEDKGISYKSFKNPEFIEIDLCSVDYKAIIEILLSIIMTKAINMKKHKIIIHNLKLSPKHIHNSVRKLIEIYSSNVLFIITVDSLSFLDQSFKSRCILLNCAVDQKTISEKIINLVRPDVMPDFQSLFTKANEDCVNIVIILQLADPMTYKDFLEEYILDRLSCLSKEKDVLKYNETLRDVCYKLTGANINISKVLPYIINYASQNKRENKIHEIIRYTAECDHKMIFTNKVVFLIEQYFDNIVDIVK